jgi:hypothetical protein
MMILTERTQMEKILIVF